MRENFVEEKDRLALQGVRLGVPLRENADSNASPVK